jgi:hypothetical protein
MRAAAVIHTLSLRALLRVAAHMIQWWQAISDNVVSGLLGDVVADTSARQLS